MSIMPTLFIGHGSPENAIQNNAFTKEWVKISKSIPTPKAILCISAHWLTDSTFATAMDNPKTIHDFYGFQDELYEIKYNAKGSKELAKSTKAILDYTWGLDHGTWSVLIHMYPKADIPVVQLSIDVNLPLEKHYEIGKSLYELRKQGILIIGSGNIVHNLGMIRLNQEPFPWAVDFDNYVKTNIEKNNHEALINYTKNKSSGFAQPTNDHYLPLLYVLGATNKEKPLFFNESFFYSSLSMRCVAFGMKE